MICQPGVDSCWLSTAYLEKLIFVPRIPNINPPVVLKRGDIEINEELEKDLVYVNFSKTNQFMHKSHVIPIPRNDDPALD